MALLVSASRGVEALVLSSIVGNFDLEDAGLLVLSWKLSNSSESSPDIRFFSRSKDRLVARCFAVPLPRKDIFSEGPISPQGPSLCR